MRTIWNGSSSRDLSGTARYSPSGDQSSCRPRASTRIGYTSATLLWTPPVTFATNTAVWLRPDRNSDRNHAIRDPSGDQAGLRSSAGSVVNLRTEPSLRDWMYKSGFSPFSPSHTYMSLLPSGEKAGCRSDPGMLVIGMICARAEPVERLRTCHVISTAAAIATTTTPAIAAAGLLRASSLIAR